MDAIASVSADAFIVKHGLKDSSVEPLQVNFSVVRISTPFAGFSLLYFRKEMISFMCLSWSALYLVLSKALTTTNLDEAFLIFVIHPSLLNRSSAVSTSAENFPEIPGEPGSIKKSSPGVNFFPLTERDIFPGKEFTGVVKV